MNLERGTRKAESCRTRYVVRHCRGRLLFFPKSMCRAYIIGPAVSAFEGMSVATVVALGAGLEPAEFTVEPFGGDPAVDRAMGVIDYSAGEFNAKAQGREGAKVEALCS